MSRDQDGVNERCTVLRQELKIWEKQFAAQNGGRKAGREDIKADVIIAPKYKEYNKLRDVLSGNSKKDEPAKVTASAQKRTPAEEVPATSSKRSNSRNKTPSKGTHALHHISHESPVSALKLSTPVIRRTMIGPTPQKDGQVLGLFDLLPTETPSKVQRTIFGDIVPNVLATPSKTPARSDCELTASGGRASRTPTSSGKRFLLDTFVTPQKRKVGDENTPSSMAKHLATPSFLRRDSLRLDALVEEPESPEITRPWKKRTFGRSLSSMIQEMKQQEENKLDEEWEIMREMEQEAGNPGITKSSVPKLQVEDSQAAVDFGTDGFDVTELWQEDEDGQQDEASQNGQPQRVWKKKGQKRQTKRVIMRPVRTRPTLLPTIQPSDDEDADDDAVPETQAASTKSIEDETDEAYGTASNNDYPSDASDASHSARKHKVPSKSKPHTVPKASEHQSGKPEGEVKKKARKVNPQAHANYCKLKIKNKNSKAKGRGRFGRGR